MGESQVESVHLLQLEGCYLNTHLSIKASSAYSLIGSSLRVTLACCTCACMLCDGGAKERICLFLTHLTATILFNCRKK